MFEQLRAFPVEYAESADREDLPTDLAERLQGDLSVNAAALPAQPENRRFELPGSVWAGMLASYAVFFASITMATGGSGRAVFAIIISILYTAMFFGVARIIARQAGPDGRSPLLGDRPLQTWCGPMDSTAVYGQILVVPMAVAGFGLGIAVICAMVL